MPSVVLLGLLLSSLISNSANACESPPQHIESVEGKKGETLLALANSNGIWMIEAEDEETKRVLSKHFKMVARDRDSRAVLYLRIVKPLRLESKRLESIDLTLTCTSKGQVQRFYRKFLLRKNTKEEKVRQAMEIYVKENTSPGAVLYELSNNTSSSTGDVYEVMERGEKNIETSTLFEVTRNGVITLRKSLLSYKGETLLLLLRHIMQNGESEITPIAVNVKSSPRIISSDQQRPPFFKLKNCRRSHCNVSLYKAKIHVDHEGEIVDMKPGKIYAEDPNGNALSYYITGGNPVSSFLFFSMDQTTGAVLTHDLELIEDHQDFFLTVQAWDDPPSDDLNTALLHITVECGMEVDQERLEDQEQIDDQEKVEDQEKAEGQEKVENPEKKEDQDDDGSSVYDELGLAEEIKLNTTEKMVVSRGLSLSGSTDVAGVFTTLTTSEPVLVPDEPHWLYDENIKPIVDKDIKEPVAEMVKTKSSGSCKDNIITLVAVLQAVRLIQSRL